MLEVLSAAQYVVMCFENDPKQQEYAIGILREALDGGVRHSND